MRTQANNSELRRRGCCCPLRFWQKVRLSSFCAAHDSGKYGTRNEAAAEKSPRNFKLPGLYPPSVDCSALSRMPQWLGSSKQSRALLTPRIGRGRILCAWWSWPIAVKDIRGDDQ